MIYPQDGDHLVFDFINHDVRRPRDNELTCALNVSDAAVGWELEKSVNAGTDNAADLLCGNRVILSNILEQRLKIVASVT
jgi:hypothetical protein